MFRSAKTEAGSNEMVSERLHVFLNARIWYYMLLSTRLPFSNRLV